MAQDAATACGQPSRRATPGRPNTTRRPSSRRAAHTQRPSGHPSAEVVEHAGALLEVVPAGGQQRAGGGGGAQRPRPADGAGERGRRRAGATRGGGRVADGAGRSSVGAVDGGEERRAGGRQRSRRWPRPPCRTAATPEAERGAGDRAGRGADDQLGRREGPSPTSCSRAASTPAWYACPTMPPAPRTRPVRADVQRSFYRSAVREWCMLTQRLRGRR